MIIRGDQAFIYMLLGFDDMIIEVTMTTENLKEMLNSILLNEASITKN